MNVEYERGYNNCKRAMINKIENKIKELENSETINEIIWNDGEYTSYDIIEILQDLLKEIK